MNLADLGVEHEPSERLIDLIFMAVDIGVETVQSGRELGRPMTPFLMVPGQDGRPSHTRYRGENLEESLGMARTAVSRLGSNVGAYAIVADGYLPDDDDEQLDAIIVEAGERGEPVAYLFAQRYRPADNASEFELIGRPAIIREVPNRFRG